MFATHHPHRTTISFHFFAVYNFQVVVIDTISWTFSARRELKKNREKHVVRERERERPIQKDGERQRKRKRERRLKEKGEKRKTEVKTRQGKGERKTYWTKFEQQRQNASQNYTEFH